MAHWLGPPYRGPVVLLVSVLIANVQRPTITLTLVIAFAVSIAVSFLP